MRLNPKEILPTVVGTVLVLTALVVAASQHQAASATADSAPKSTACQHACKPQC